MFIFSLKEGKCYIIFQDILWNSCLWLVSELQNSSQCFVCITFPPLMRSQHTWITYCRCFDKPAAVHIIKGSIIRTTAAASETFQKCLQTAKYLRNQHGSFIFKNITPAEIEDASYSSASTYFKNDIQKLTGCLIKCCWLHS